MKAKTNYSAVDELGSLLAQINDLETKAQAIKNELKDMGAGTYKGDLFQATVTFADRATPDKVLQVETKALVEKHFTRQFITAHTNIKNVGTVKVTSRNDTEAEAA